jgi:hypothetical protein
MSLLEPDGRLLRRLQTGTVESGAEGVVSRAVSAAEIFYSSARWSEKVQRLREAVALEPSEDAKRYLARANSIAKFTWEPGDLDILAPDGTWAAFGDPLQQPYGLFVRDQSGALRILEELGAMDEIAGAVIGHCEQFRPEPPYKPELLKGRLAEQGWLREVRVPPPSPDLDELPINDRYDALKFFRRGAHEVGVAVEIEGWEISNDLIKCWRGHTRRQIAVGVLVQPDPGTARYCFEQMRLLTKPLFGHVPIAFLAPDGPGLVQSVSSKERKYAPFPMQKAVEADSG